MVRTVVSDRHLSSLERETIVHNCRIYAGPSKLYNLKQTSPHIGIQNNSRVGEWFADARYTFSCVTNKMIFSVFFKFQPVAIFIIYTRRYTIFYSSLRRRRRAARRRLVRERVAWGRGDTICSTGTTTSTTSTTITTGTPVRPPTRLAIPRRRLMVDRPSVDRWTRWWEKERLRGSSLSRPPCRQPVVA